MYYKLVNKEVVPIKGSPEKQVLEWGKHFSSEDKFIDRTTVGKILVSTVFLGLDHSMDHGDPPLLFETMVFLANDSSGLGEDLGQWRCSTYIEAKAQHRSAVEKIKAGMHL